MAKKIVPENARTKAKAQALRDFGRQMTQQPGFRMLDSKRKGPSFKRAPK